MPRTPHAYVLWKGKSHDHLVPMGDGNEIVLENEEAAELLAESVSKCSPENHKGHGSDHAFENEVPIQVLADKVYEEALKQIEETDFEAEWAEIQQKIAAYKRWGGQPPAAIIMPDAQDPKQWNLVRVNPDGTATIEKVRPGVLGDFPTPNRRNSYPDKQGISFRTRRRLTP